MTRELLERIERALDDGTHAALLAEVRAEIEKKLPMVYRCKCHGTLYGTKEDCCHTDQLEPFQI